MANDEYRDQHERDRAAGLAARHETRVERAILRAEWKAQEDDTIGGWCITDAAMPGTPADGNAPIAHFVHAETARHMAAVHNIWLANRGYLPVHGSVVDTIRVQVAEEVALALEEFARNDPRGRSDMDIDRAAAIARSIGSPEHSNQATEETK